GKPIWVHNQRNSWHGIDFPYHSELDIREYRRAYNRSLSAVDESLGEILAWLEAQGLSENTIVILMGDNGFMFGEHGLIDKRNAYEESMRVPLIMYAPSKIIPGSKIDEVVANLDIAPTILEWAGLTVPDHYEGRSMATLIEQGEDQTWRDTLFYEYFWEYDFPHTPTTFAIRTPTHKLIQYHGVWDMEELYNIVEDPNEMINLIDDPELIETKIELRKALFEGVQNSQGENTIRYTERSSSGTVFRHEDRSTAGDFPDRWLRPADAPDRTQQFTPDSTEKIERFGTITAPKPETPAD
ncbi:MAG: sulfatase/phosphatase domain-containing protein, partial [Pseudomonadota bacterium]